MHVTHLLISSVVLVVSLVVFIVSSANLKKKVDEIYRNPDKYL